jgi:hypothetical protein
MITNNFRNSLIIKYISIILLLAFILQNNCYGNNLSINNKQDTSTNFLMPKTQMQDLDGQWAKMAIINAILPLLPLFTEGSLDIIAIKEYLAELSNDKTYRKQVEKIANIYFQGKKLCLEFDSSENDKIEISLESVKGSELSTQNTYHREELELETAFGTRITTGNASKSTAVAFYCGIPTDVLKEFFLGMIDLLRRVLTWLTRNLWHAISKRWQTLVTTLGMLLIIVSVFGSQPANAQSHMGWDSQQSSTSLSLANNPHKFLSTRLGISPDNTSNLFWDAHYRDFSFSGQLQTLTPWAPDFPNAFHTNMSLKYRLLPVWVLGMNGGIVKNGVGFLGAETLINSTRIGKIGMNFGMLIGDSTGAWLDANWRWKIRNHENSISITGISLFTGERETYEYNHSIQITDSFMTRQSIHPAIDLVTGVNFDIAFYVDSNNRIKDRGTQSTQILNVGAPVILEFYRGGEKFISQGIEATFTTGDFISTPTELKLQMFMAMHDIFDRFDLIGGVAFDGGGNALPFGRIMADLSKNWQLSAYASGGRPDPYFSEVNDHNWQLGIMLSYQNGRIKNIYPFMPYRMLSPNAHRIRRFLLGDPYRPYPGRRQPKDKQQKTSNTIPANKPKIKISTRTYWAYKMYRKYPKLPKVIRGVKFYDNRFRRFQKITDDIIFYDKEIPLDEIAEFLIAVAKSRTFEDDNWLKELMQEVATDASPDVRDKLLNVVHNYETEVLYKDIKVDKKHPLFEILPGLAEVLETTVQGKYHEGVYNLVKDINAGKDIVFPRLARLFEDRAIGQSSRYRPKISKTHALTRKIPDLAFILEALHNQQYQTPVFKIIYDINSGAQVPVRHLANTLIPQLKSKALKTSKAKTRTFRFAMRFAFDYWDKVSDSHKGSLLAYANRNVSGWRIRSLGPKYAVGKATQKLKAQKASLSTELKHSLWLYLNNAVYYIDSNFMYGVSRKFKDGIPHAYQKHSKDIKDLGNELLQTSNEWSNSDQGTLAASLHYYNTKSPIPQATSNTLYPKIMEMANRKGINRFSIPHKTAILDTCLKHASHNPRVVNEENFRRTVGAMLRVKNPIFLTCAAQMVYNSPQRTQLLTLAPYAQKTAEVTQQLAQFQVRYATGSNNYKYLDYLRDIKRLRGTKFFSQKRYSFGALIARYHIAFSFYEILLVKQNLCEPNKAKQTATKAIQNTTITVRRNRFWGGYVDISMLGHEPEIMIGPGDFEDGLETIEHELVHWVQWEKGNLIPKMQPAPVRSLPVCQMFYPTVKAYVPAIRTMIKAGVKKKRIKRSRTIPKAVRKNRAFNWLIDAMYIIEKHPTVIGQFQAIFGKHLPKASTSGPRGRNVTYRQWKDLFHNLAGGEHYYASDVLAMYLVHMADTYAGERKYTPELAMIFLAHKKYHHSIGTALAASLASGRFWTKHGQGMINRMTDYAQARANRPGTLSANGTRKWVKHLMRQFTIAQADYLTRNTLPKAITHRLQSRGQSIPANIYEAVIWPDIEKTYNNTSLLLLHRILFTQESRQNLISFFGNTAVSDYERNYGRIAKPISPRIFIQKLATIYTTFNHQPPLYALQKGETIGAESTWAIARGDSLGRYTDMIREMAVSVPRADATICTDWETHPILYCN